MSRSPARFTEDEIYSAVRGAARAGTNVAVEISPDGTIRLVPVGPAADNAASVKPSPVVAPLREILKLEDVAKHWNTSTGFVRRAVEAGKIRHFRIGKLIRIKREEVERIDCEGGLPEKAAQNLTLRNRPDAFELGRRSRNAKPKSK